VFINLMLNAIEAMEDSGEELTVKSQLQDGQLRFSVSDTGVGLPGEKMDQIFSAFFTTKVRAAAWDWTASSVFTSYRKPFSTPVRMKL
jgi:C4-dicarboxylate-specific signal transduction histidine kinase